MEKSSEQLIEEAKTEISEEEPRFEDQGLPVEDLDFWTLSFLREHIDMDMSEAIDFNPDEELSMIKKAIAEFPTEEQSTQKQLLIYSFKRRLKILRENMAKAQIELEGFIKSNPDIGQEALLQKVEEIATQNKVKSLANYLKESVSKYLESRSGILGVVNRFKKKYGDFWQEELFLALFGQKPKGKIEIDILPMNLYFKIYNLENYAVARGSSMEVAKRSGGGQLNKNFDGFPELSSKVIIENSSVFQNMDQKKFQEQFSSETKAHEEEHSIHNILYPKNVFSKHTPSLLKEMVPGTVLENKVFIRFLNQCAHAVSSQFLAFAKSEILAYLKQMQFISHISKYMNNPNGLYNYLEDDLEKYVHSVNHWLQKNNLRIKKEDGTEMNEEEVKIAYANTLKGAWEKKYLPVLNKALNALQKLFEKYRSNPDKYPEITRLLSQEPLSKWHRLVKILS